MRIKSTHDEEFEEGLRLEAIAKALNLKS